MNLLLLYFLLVKATLTSYSGLGSLPMVRHDFVVDRHLLTDQQLNEAVAAGRAGPGPLGLYVVGVGFLVAGIPGAIAGWLAMITPAFLVLPLLRFIGARASQPRVRSAIRLATLASAGLLLAATVPLGRGVVSDAFTAMVAAAAFCLLAFTNIDSLWLIAGSALAGLLRVVLV